MQFSLLSSLINNIKTYYVTITNFVILVCILCSYLITYKSFLFFIVNMVEWKTNNNAIKN